MGNIITTIALILSFFVNPTLILAQIPQTPEEAERQMPPSRPSELGTISPPPTIPTAGIDPSGFVAGLVKGFLQLLIVAAFIVALIWTIIAGYKFIFAGGDPKDVAAAWSQIYWGLIGLVIVVGAFAIIKMVEVFFGIKVISDFQLPQR